MRTRRRCQRRMVSGVTRRWQRSARGSRRIERGEDGPVRPVQAWSGVGAAQHGDLVPQHEQLDVLGGGRAAQQQDQPEHLLEDQIQQPQRHGGDHARPPKAADHRWSARGGCVVVVRACLPFAHLTSGRHTTTSGSVCAIRSGEDVLRRAGNSGRHAIDSRGRAPRTAPPQRTACSPRSGCTAGVGSTRKNSAARSSAPSSACRRWSPPERTGRSARWS